MADDKHHRKGEATRRALMEAGFRVFAERGFLRAQISDIVREAGKSSGVFYLYFRNKEELLDAWLDECDQMVPWHQANISLLFEKAHDFMLQSLWAMYERFGPILDALDAASLVSDHFRTRLDIILKKNDDSVAHMIRHAQSEGRYRGIDPELTAISIGLLIRRSTSYWFRHRQSLEARGFDRQAAMANLETLYARMLEWPEISKPARQLKRPPKVLAN